MPLPAVIDPAPQASELPIFRAKAAAMAEIALEDAYLKAVDNETPLKMKMEFVDLCSKLADLHPKLAQQAQIGPGFSINIVYGDVPGVKAVNIIENTVETPLFDRLDPPKYCNPALSAVFNLDLNYDETLLETSQNG